MNHEVIISGRNAWYSGQSLSQATRENSSQKKNCQETGWWELPGGFVSAIAGTSSAKTIASPLENIVNVSTAYYTIHKDGMPLLIQVPINMTGVYPR
jgi:hypothetical protein